jgi:hypothetical protein
MARRQLRLASLPPVPWLGLCYRLAHGRQGPAPQQERQSPAPLGRRADRLIEEGGTPTPRRMVYRLSPSRSRMTRFEFESETLWTRPKISWTLV